jgi:hypothetical protein
VGRCTTLAPPTMMKRGRRVSPIQAYPLKGLVAAPGVSEHRLGAGLALHGTFARP